MWGWVWLRRRFALAVQCLSLGGKAFVHFDYDFPEADGMALQVVHLTHVVACAHTVALAVCS
jgi:hypothetical protein